MTPVYLFIFLKKESTKASQSLNLPPFRQSFRFRAANKPRGGFWREPTWHLNGAEAFKIGIFVLSPATLNGRTRLLSALARGLLRFKKWVNHPPGWGRVEVVGKPWWNAEEFICLLTVSATSGCWGVKFLQRIAKLIFWKSKYGIFFFFLLKVLSIFFKKGLSWVRNCWAKLHTRVCVCDDWKQTQN